MHKVLITGITGFLGANIAEKLLESNISVIGLKRKSSDIWRCLDFSDKIIWIDIDEEGLYKEEIKKHFIDTIIHGAWIGVESIDRNNWIQQSKNIPFLIELLELARTVGVKKFLFLGSQAEYGNLQSKISEDHNAEAVNAYGSIKLACLEIVRTFCQDYGINWVWLRIFSIFGEKENENWLIPSLVKSMLNVKEMDLTPGNQKYAYLYVKDFSTIVYKIIVEAIESGVYNVSSNEIRSLKSLIEDIKNRVNPNFILNFGALQYRENQSMHIEGNILKLCNQIGEIEFTDYQLAMNNILKYYLKNE